MQKPGATWFFVPTSMIFLFETGLLRILQRGGLKANRRRFRSNDSNVVFAWGPIRFNESWSRYFNLRGGWSTSPKNAGMSPKNKDHYKRQTVVFQQHHFPGRAVRFRGVWHVNHPRLLFFKGTYHIRQDSACTCQSLPYLLPTLRQRGEVFHPLRTGSVNQTACRFNHSFAVVVSQESVQTGCQKTCITISHRETQLQNNGSEVWFALFPSG